MLYNIDNFCCVYKYIYSLLFNFYGKMLIMNNIVLIIILFKILAYCVYI